MTFAPLLIVTFSAYNLECLYVLLDVMVTFLILPSNVGVARLIVIVLVLPKTLLKPRGVTFMVSPLPDVAL